MAYNIETITNQYGSKAILLRHAQRDGNKIRKKTIANLSRFPPEIVQGFRAILKGGIAVANIHDHLTIQRSLPHGHVKAALGTARQLGLEKILVRSPSRQRSLALAAIITRLIAPDSKLATARTLSDKSATSSLGSLLKLGDVSGNDMLATLDWLLARQPRIEQALARRHLDAATLLLYDVSSTYLEGSQCPLARFGYNRDKKKGKQQLVFGLLCTTEGCPVTVEVFAGNTGDPTTLSAQIAKVQARFGIRNIALVGDRGMITSARIREDLKPADLNWISALKTTDLRKLVAKQPKGVPSLIQPLLMGEYTTGSDRLVRNWFMWVVYGTAKSSVI